MLQTFLPTGLVTWGESRYQGGMKWPVEAICHKLASPSVMAITTSNHGERQNLEPFLNIQPPRLRLSYERHGKSDRRYFYSPSTEVILLPLTPTPDQNRLFLVVSKGQLDGSGG